VNEGSVTLVRSEQLVPDILDAAGTTIVPFHAGEAIGWKISSMS